MARSRYGNRPALDGVRGVAMLTFMAFHLGVGWLQGAWVAVNVFFVLSGFLIVRLLLEERVTYGDIRPLEFYRRRMRRLLPGLFLLLGTLTVYGVFIAGDDVRRPLRSDMLATLGYVMNWRLILRDDQYFEMFGNPSFLRHAWTLAVEEQFYLIAPFLVSLLVLFLWRRSHQVAVLLLLAAASAVWTANVGLADQSAQAHAYYGTDTRVQALLIGAALAFVLGPKSNGRDPRRLPTSVVAALGWGGLAAMLAGYIFIPPFASWMFGQGGMALFSLAFAGLVLACADPRRSLLTTVLGQRPIAYLGKLSYGLYLWHWPIHLWLQDAWPDLPVWLAVVIGMALTIGIAAASYRFIEQPVMRRGVRALLPGRRGRRGRGRVLVAASLGALLLGAYVVGKVPAAATSADTGPNIQLIPGSATYKPGTTHVKVGIFGDSVPYLLNARMPRSRYPDLDVVNLAVPGCDLVDIDIRWTPDKRGPNSPECLRGKRTFDATLRSSKSQVFVLFGGALLSMPHITPDGTVLQIDDPRMQRLITARLDEFRRRAKAAGVQQMQVVTVPCRDVKVQYIPEEYRPYMRAHPEIVKAATDPVALNTLMKSWAAKNDVAVIDMYQVLCSDGFHARRNGLEIFGDAIHFSPEATPMIWTWLAPQIRAAYQRGAHS
ncbi:acyltransferase family protein [Luteipulveratus mongoliensis]|uniref:acyltransferase family protein n=1 Tax=Luteipulveratus mongoliensis TaxID=571913 RepID=UPI000697CA5C|nr:acyltransferase [Luteipulveratus mongoliensis]